jgi:single-strand DNA-binding protein
MNDCKFTGRLTRDPEIRYTDGAQPMAIARYTLAVDRKYKKDGAQQADFLNVVAFGKTAEFAEKYLRKGTKILVTSHAQSGSYTDKNGNKVYYTEFVADAHEFCESKNSAGSGQSDDGFMNIPDGIEDELPFN